MSLSLDKISLSKDGEVGKLSLKKSAAKEELIEINLNWSQPEKREGLGALLGMKPKQLDLDVGALIELADGTKYVVQPLGNTFGAMDAPPYLHHSGDDRSGASASGEFLRIRLANWKYFKRVCVYTYIYEGAPDWATAKGVVTLRVPGQPELEVSMGLQKDKAPLCAIAMLTNPKSEIHADLQRCKVEVTRLEGLVQEVEAERVRLSQAYHGKTGREPSGDGPAPSFFATLLPDFLAPPDVLRARWAAANAKVQPIRSQLEQARSQHAAKEQEILRSDDEIQVQRLMTFHPRWQQGLDAHYHWGLSWAAGSK
jgi:tellurite resistance protein TerA